MSKGEASFCLCTCFTMRLNVVVTTLQESAFKSSFEPAILAVERGCSATSEAAEVTTRAIWLSFGHIWLGRAQAIYSTTAGGQLKQVHKQKLA